MKTECGDSPFEFPALGTRRITAVFDGGTITSDASGVLLREVEIRTSLLAQLARCFDDDRDPELIKQA